MGYVYSFGIFLHVVSGCIAVCSGVIALTVAKGHRLHARVGLVFVATMGASALLGAMLGLISYAGNYITFPAGLLTLTLIASSWLAIRADQQAGDRSKLALAVVVSINTLNTCGLLVAGFIALRQPTEILFEYPAEDYFFLFGMAALSLLGDARLVFTRQPLSRQQGVLRHLWRMGLALFIAVGSAFGGPGAAVFPQSVRESGALVMPEVLVLLASLYFFIRVKRERWFVET